MEARKEKVIIIVSIAILSLLAIFFLFKAAVSPAAPDSSLLEVKKLFSQKQEQPTTQLPIDEPKPITITFGGDVMLSRHVNDKMAKYGDYSWPFLKISDLLGSSDLTAVNLESPFAESKSYYVPTGSFMFKADPKSAAGLSAAGIDIVSLANNHIMNQGGVGLEKTLQILTETGIMAVGAGKNDVAARQAGVANIRGKRIAFLAYAYPEDGSVASNKRPGIAGMDVDLMTEDIKDSRTQADIVIVMMHAGEEYTAKPNRQQISFAHAAIDSGADLVIGHHPHWPQEYEFYKGKPIIYSLGNLIFDQMWSPETSLGLVASLEWQDGWTEIRLIPVKIRDYGQAEVLPDSPEKAALFKKLNIPDDGIIKPEPES